MIPIFLGVTIFTFVLFNLVGGSPALRLAGKYATAEQISNIKSELGLDKSLPEQYLVHLKQIVTMDFGRSWTSKQEITAILADAIPVTLCLTLPSFLMSLIFCVGLSLYLVYVRGSKMDKSTVVLCLGFISISSLVYILFFQNILAYQAGLFPVSGWDPSWIDRWRYLTLPWIILFVLSLGGDILIYRAVIADEAFQDYVRTARAKGMVEKKVFGRHILRNGMMPVVTVVFIQLTLLLSGAVLVERYFGIPGLGSTVLQGLSDSDFPVIKAITIVTTILYMVFNLISDLLYAYFDPRVRLN